MTAGAIGRPETAHEVDRRLPRHRQQSGHAGAGVQDQHQIERHLPGSEQADGLRLAVLEHLEVLDPQVGHVLSLLIDDGDLKRDQVDVAAKHRLRRRRDDRCRQDDRRGRRAEAPPTPALREG